MIYKFSDIVEINPKVPIKKGDFVKKIAMQDIKENQRQIQSYTVEEFKSGTKFQQNDTLFARITPCLENGKIAQVKILDENEVAFGSTEFLVFRAIEELVLPDYVFFLARSSYIRENAIKSMTGTSGRQRVQNSVFSELDIELPNLNDQKKIVTILNSFDRKIEVNNKIIDNLEQQAQAIFKSWFIDFESFQDGEFVDSEIGSIPKGWRVSTLDKIADYKNGLAMQKFPPTDNNSSLPVLKIRELNLNATNESSDRCDINIDSDVIVNDGDVIFSWSGTLLVKIWTGDVAGLNQHLFKVTSKKYDKWFYYLWTKFHLNKFISIAKDKATTMGHIKRSHLNESKVYICDDLSYKNIHNIISPIIEQRINLGIQNRKLAATRDLLLPKLLSGELDVSDFDI